MIPHLHLNYLSSSNNDSTSFSIDSTLSDNDSSSVDNDSTSSDNESYASENNAFSYGNGAISFDNGLFYLSILHLHWIIIIYLHLLIIHLHLTMTHLHLIIIQLHLPIIHLLSDSDITSLAQTANFRKNDIPDQQEYLIFSSSSILAILCIGGKAYSFLRKRVLCKMKKTYKDSTNMCFSQTQASLIFY